MPATTGPHFPRLEQAIAREADRLMSPEDDRGTVVALTELIEFLQQQLHAVTLRRDQAITNLLGESKSNRRLAAELGLSRQRIDQLARVAQQGRPEVPGRQRGPDKPAERPRA